MKSDKSGNIQYAALPWRRGPNGLEILMITSRETRRWVIPKGWPMAGAEPGQCAAIEAFEEAGIEGRITASIGTFPYLKVLKDDEIRPVSVEVFPLEVMGEAEIWPEAAERERRWFDPATAALSVDEPELAALIRSFAP